MVLGARLAGRLLILPLALVSLSMNTAQGSKMITSLHGAFSKSVKFPEGQGVIMFEPVITVLHIHWQIHPQPTQPCNNSLGFAGLATVAEGHRSASHCWAAASGCHLHPVPSCTLPAVHSIIMHVCVLSRFSHVRLCTTPWTVAHLAPLSVGFSRQEYWSGLPCPPPGDLPNPEVKPSSLMSPALAGRFFTTSAT